MKKIFLDTNIWVRPLVEKNSQTKEIKTLIQQIDSSHFSPYTSTIVLLEVSFILRSFYKLKNNQIFKEIQIILATKNLTLIESTNLLESLKLHQQTKIKLTDCLIATQLPPKTTLVTFNEDFQKIPTLSVKTPAEII